MEDNMERVIHRECVTSEDVERARLAAVKARRNAKLSYDVGAIMSALIGLAIFIVGFAVYQVVAFKDTPTWKATTSVDTPSGMRFQISSSNSLGDPYVVGRSGCGMKGHGSTDSAGEMDVCLGWRHAFVVFDMDWSIPPLCSCVGASGSCMVTTTTVGYLYVETSVPGDDVRWVCFQKLVVPSAKPIGG